MGRSNHYALFHGITLTLTDNAFHPQNKADIANKMFADPSFSGDYRTSMIFRDFWVTLENDTICLQNQYDIRDGIILDSRLKDTLKFAFLFRLSRQNHTWLFEYQIIMGMRFIGYYWRLNQNDPSISLVKIEHSWVISELQNRYTGSVIENVQLDSFRLTMMDQIETWRSEQHHRLTRVSEERVREFTSDFPDNVRTECQAMAQYMLQDVGEVEGTTSHPFHVQTTIKRRVIVHSDTVDDHFWFSTPLARL